MTQPISMIVEIATEPAQRDRQLAAFGALAPIVRAEPGCRRYELHAVDGEPDRFVILEEWESQGALDAHDIAPHMVAADAANRAFRAGPARVVKLIPTGL